MKPPAQHRLKFLPAILCLLAFNQSVKAVNQYFDVNGTSAGYGIANGGTYSWDASNWATNSGGTSAVGPWVPGSFARFPGGVSGNNYTVTVANSESMAGLFMSVTGVTLNINAVGSGNLNVAAGAQGFLVNGPVIINAPIVGTGGVGPEYNASGAAVSLFASNSYSGGTFFGFTGSAPLTWFNNNNSFGTGPMTLMNATNTYWAILSVGGAPITLANAFTNTVGGAGINFANGANAPVTCTGNWGLAGNYTFIRNNGDSTAPLTLSGVISGTAGVNFSGNNGGTITLSGTNTYTGGTTVAFATPAGTLVVPANGALAGNVTVSSGGLKLDKVGALSSSASLNLVSSLASGAVNLNFSGTQVVSSINIDSISQASGTWGSPSSGAQNTSSLFSGNGILNIQGAPVVVQQPSSITRFDGQSGSFAVVVSGAAPFTYQWKFNGNAISGATDSSYPISNLTTNNAGSYSCGITNAFGGTISLGATLAVQATNNYSSAILADSPISYWRLDEASGTVAHDAVSTNSGTYVNVTLSQPGYTQLDPDTCIGLPASAGQGFVQVTNSAPFAFPGVTTFALEAWVNFTNVNGVQRIFSTFAGVAPSRGYAFGISGGNVLRFTTSGVQDADQSLATALVPGLWYHLVVTCDLFNYHFYVNGHEVGTPITIIGGGNTGVNQPLQLGCNPASYIASFPTAAEQLNGRIDEAAIYNFLTADQVLAHYNAKPIGPPGVGQPVATPSTNYESLSSVIQAVADGQSLQYQWFKGTTALSGQTSNTLTISPLHLSDSGTYKVQVSNPMGTTNSPDVTLTVLPIPTSATVLNLTNGLVLHLPFDGDYADISGHSNNGTNVGATTFVSPGAIGAHGLHYSTDADVGSTNYVTLGVRPDLQFGANLDFTVAFWVRQPAGSTYTNLPFFTDAVGSTAQGGFAFAPYAGTGGGGWMYTIGTVTSPNLATTFPDANLINDGNWHHLVHVASRTANCTTYLDGIQVDSQAITISGNINTTNAATIGQDPTGAYPVTAQADLDDLGVWQRALTPLEVSGIYLAGATNSVSFAPPPPPQPVPVALHVQQSAGQLQITWTGTGGVLQASGIVSGTYTNVPSASSPYTIPASGPQMFYRLKY
ncbi:LamG-like jellyroll fold domain-containing protein [Pedosphaera parvula]|uniref:Immunoglobulin V-set domain protein n=1 Tax=Pedosphaera parvula (strain Ellin514) TaxID=320771 RepID=B9XDU4_PEDPL|nr:LamG-like jellyroll fold domain-containing protein [Pedosphaera parvula]EEF61835.1 Immunoglobulin V-set domain protein [Pedosphaera parvula Ellin514]